MAPYYVCAECNEQMRPEKNGVYVIEMADFGPYKIWMADLWACPECTHEALVGFGLKPLAEHYQEGFKEMLKKVKASGRCYYC